MDASVQEVHRRHMDEVQDAQTLYRHMRSVIVTGFPCMRNGGMSLHVKNLYYPYRTVEQLDEEVRRQFGVEVYRIACDYLACLALKGMYVLGDLSKKVIVWADGGVLYGVQLVPDFLTRRAQPLSYLTALAAALGAVAGEAFEGAARQLDYYFPTVAQPAGPRALSDVVVQVRSVQDVARALSAGVPVKGTTPLYPEELLGLCARAGHFVDMDLNSAADDRACELWLLLARLCNARRAVAALADVPWPLHTFVRYDCPVPLPDTFTAAVRIAREPRQLLRMVLGMHPEYLAPAPPAGAPTGGVPPALADAVAHVPAWYQTRFWQIAFLTHHITLGDELRCGGSDIVCPATPDAVVALCDHYE